MYRKRRQAGLLFLLSLFSVIANRVNAEFFELQVLIELVCFTAFRVVRCYGFLLVSAKCCVIAEFVTESHRVHESLWLLSKMSK